MIRYCKVLHQIATYCNGWNPSLPSCKRSWTRYWAVTRSWTGCGSWARLRWSITEQWLERLLIYMSMIIYIYIQYIYIIIYYYYYHYYYYYCYYYYYWYYYYYILYHVRLYYIKLYH